MTALQKIIAQQRATQIFQVLLKRDRALAMKFNVEIDAFGSGRPLGVHALACPDTLKGGHQTSAGARS